MITLMGGFDYRIRSLTGMKWMCACGTGTGAETGTGTGTGTGWSSEWKDRLGDIQVSGIVTVMINFLWSDLT